MSVVDVTEKERFRFPSAAFLWPALAAEAASEFAAIAAREFTSLAIGSPPPPNGREPPWATPHEVALELGTLRLRDFSTSGHGNASLICAPYALHAATITDFAADHSLVAALQRAGVQRLFVTDWRTADPDMRFLSIDDYLAELNVVVDELGGEVDLIGLCQGGWMAMVYAARFPGKVRRLVLAGAPIDIAAGDSTLSGRARETPMSVFRTLVELGSGRVLGHRLLQFWDPLSSDRKAVHRLLQPLYPVDSSAFRELDARFRDWYAWTLDLPGVYYLQVVEQLYKENRLPAGRFAALGRQIDLSKVQCPLFLLAARDDEVVAPEQLFAAERLVGTQRDSILKSTAPCEHLGLFMGRAILSNSWPAIAHWLVQPADSCRRNSSSVDAEIADQHGRI
jgi:poly(3-hydroxyalkanoate) synthetase